MEPIALVSELQYFAGEEVVSIAEQISCAVEFAGTWLTVEYHLGWFLASGELELMEVPHSSQSAEKQEPQLVVRAAVSIVHQDTRHCDLAAGLFAYCNRLSGAHGSTTHLGGFVVCDPDRLVR